MKENWMDLYLDGMMADLKAVESAVLTVYVTDGYLVWRKVVLLADLLVELSVVC